ncbi:MAG: iron ABC transporter permease [Candidatus Parcubacteria bacterium]|nr:iron ABC transporter permease [Burkholderiales bacterium]
MSLATSLSTLSGDPRASPAQRWLWLGAMLGTALLVVYPLGMFLVGSFRSAPWGDPGAAWTMAGYIGAYTDPYTWKLVGNTLLIGAMTLVGVMTVSVGFAWLITRSDIPFKPFLEVMVITPYFLPAVVSGASWSILGNPRNGLLNTWLSLLVGEPVAPINLYSYTGIAFVLVTYIAPMAYLLIAPLFRNIDSSMEESSYVSGASTLRTFSRITLPVLAPGLLGIGLLMAIKSLETFEVPFMLGMPSRIGVFTTEIYAALTFTPPADYARATAIAILLVAITAGLVLPFQRFVARNDKRFITVRGKGHVARMTRLRAWRWPIFALCAAYGAISFLLPLYPIALASVSKVFGVYQADNFTLEHIRHVVETPLLRRGLFNSMGLALGAATLGCMWAFLIAHIVHRSRLRGRGLLDFVSYLPVSIPGIALGLALLWGYLATPGLSHLYGTHWILLIAYMTVTLPFAIRTVSAAMLQIDPELEEASRMHGAGLLRTWRSVLVPLMRPGLVGAWTLLFILVVREVGASVLLSTSDTVVLSVLVIEHWNSGVLGLVAAMSCYMIAVIGGAVALRKLLGGRFDTIT